VANTPAFYDLAKISAVKSYIIHMVGENYQTI